ncbi:MAG: phage tail assembly protein [Nocardioides sp.]
MSKTFTLDDIRDAADKKYGSTVFELGDHKVELLNPLRMEKEKRAELVKLQEESQARAKASEAGEDVEERDEEQDIDGMLMLIAATEGQAREMIRALNLAEKMAAFELYSSEAEPGEASRSQD